MMHESGGVSSSAIKQPAFLRWCSGRRVSGEIMNAIRYCLFTTAACLSVGFSASNALAQGDPGAGEGVYSLCLACHALAYDSTGPRHCGLIGRRAASIKSFAYSEAMKKSGIIWSEKMLDRFLADPKKAVPGTAMDFQGVPDSRDRADLIAYLKQANDSEECKDSH
jgi:cytochrome c